MGEIIAPKYVELIGIINKPLLLHLVGCLYYCINDARSYKRQIQKPCRPEIRNIFLDPTVQDLKTPRGKRVRGTVYVRKHSMFENTMSYQDFIFRKIRFSTT